MILPLSAACIGCKWTKIATWLVLSYAITTIEKITPAIRLQLFCQWVLLLIPYFITVWPSIKKLHTLFALSVANTSILSNPLGDTSVSKPGLWQKQHVSIISPSAKCTIYRYRCLTISKSILNVLQLSVSTSYSWSKQEFSHPDDIKMKQLLIIKNSLLYITVKTT